MDLLQKSKENAQSWLSATFDESTQQAVRQMLEGNPDELTECFHKNGDRYQPNESLYLREKHPRAK